MLRHFQEYITKQKLVSREDCVLLAVSGGIDSMVMCRLFHEAGIPFVMAHCNFKLRGKESDVDESFVRHAAKQYKVKCFVKAFDTKRFMKLQKVSLQMAARELRYKWFEEVRKKEGCTYIATAHHRSDAIETFFINLLRGSGIKGLRGILPKQGKIIRPLLFAKRNEIKDFAGKNKIMFREDSSNASDKYLRNKIRHKLIPLLSELNPEAEMNIENTIERIKQTEALIQLVFEKDKKRIVKSGKGFITIDIKGLKNLAYTELFLYLFLNPSGFSGGIINDIADALYAQPGKQFYSDKYMLTRDRTKMILVKKSTTQKREFLVKPNTKGISSPLNLVFSKIKNYPGIKLKTGAEVALLNMQHLEFPLKIRTWQAGDWFIPFGMKGKKKLSDFYTDNKFSVIDKENTWLLCSGNNIVWVIGHRIDYRYKIEKNTREIFKVELCS